MLTAQNIIDSTIADEFGNRAWKRRASVNSRVASKKRWKEGSKTVTTVKVYAKDVNGSGILHTLEVDFFGPLSRSTKVRLYCTCDSFLYACDEALYHDGSSELLGSDGSGYSDDGPNPSGTVRACKHLLNYLMKVRK